MEIHGVFKNTSSPAAYIMDEIDRFHKLEEKLGETALHVLRQHADGTFENKFDREELEKTNKVLENLL